MRTRHPEGIEIFPTLSRVQLHAVLFSLKVWVSAHSRIGETKAGVVARPLSVFSKRIPAQCFRFLSVECDEVMSTSSASILYTADTHTHTHTQRHGPADWPGKVSLICCRYALHCPETLTMSGLTCSCVGDIRLFSATIDGYEQQALLCICVCVCVCVCVCACTCGQDTSCVVQIVVPSEHLFLPKLTS